MQHHTGTPSAPVGKRKVSIPPEQGTNKNENPHKRR